MIKVRMGEKKVIKLQASDTSGLHIFNKRFEGTLHSGIDQNSYSFICPNQK
jgi:hypothetical protein